MELEAHFTHEDRKTLQKLSEHSAVLESMLDRAISDIKDLGNNFASQSDMVDIQKRMDKQEDSVKWIVRLVIGTVILGILYLLIPH